MADADADPRKTKSLWLAKEVTDVCVTTLNLGFWNVVADHYNYNRDSIRVLHYRAIGRTCRSITTVLVLPVVQCYNIMLVAGSSRGTCTLCIVVLYNYFLRTTSCTTTTRKAGKYHQSGITYEGTRGVLHQFLCTVEFRWV
jgi:hypothetical protein